MKPFHGMTALALPPSRAPTLPSPSRAPALPLVHPPSLSCTHPSFRAPAFPLVLVHPPTLSFSCTHLPSRSHCRVGGGGAVNAAPTAVVAGAVAVAAAVAAAAAHVCMLLLMCPPVLRFVCVCSVLVLSSVCAPVSIKA